jgi:tripartite ATP-independent transporter DctM subunit
MTILANASPLILTAAMFGLSMIFVFIGSPVAFSLFGAAFLVGITTMGPKVFSLFQLSAYSQITSYALLAIPLFIFMGNMIEVTGITEGMFNSLFNVMGHIRGGLLVVCIILGTVLAACVGVIAASIILLTLVGMPIMMKHGYDKSLSCGTIVASGSLGILIPPSVMLVVYGPTAGISVGKLFMSAFSVGFLISGLYIAYVLIITRIKPELAPKAEYNTSPLSVKIKDLVVSFLPPLFVILAVLGSIMFGIASPTEAAAVGALSTILLAMAYKKFSLKALKDALISTAKATAMTMMIIVSAKCFTNLFLRLGCDSVVTDFIVNMPGGKWGSFSFIMFTIFILGMLIDWIGIVLILVPIITPLAAELGFNDLWFAMMCIVMLQTGFLSPPFAQGIFFLKGTVKPEWEIQTIDIIKGIIPFLLIIILTFGLCIIFPGILTWLPSITVGV